MSVVIVGASVAGLNVATGLRSAGYADKVTLIDRDSRMPYDKPPLSKHALKPGWEHERALLRPPGYYAENQIDLMLGTTAVGFSPWSDGGGTVHLDDGRAVSGNTVVLAPGVRPRLLPDQPKLAGVWSIRTADDSDGLRTALAPGARVVVAGGGFIGGEAAGVALERGCEVTVVELAKVPLAHLFGSDVGRALTERHLRRGIRVIAGVGVDRLEGDDAVRRVVLSDGRVLEADVVVLGLGAVPATEWLDGAVELSDGILTDEHGRTSVRGVYAVGDAAAWWNPDVGRHVRVEHWMAAKEQASAVALTIAHPDAAPAAIGPVPYFWSDQHGARLQFLGVSAGADEIHVVSGSLEEEQFVVLFSRDGRLIGALGLDDARTLMPYRQHIAAGAPIGPLLDDARVARAAV